MSKASKRKAYNHLARWYDLLAGFAEGPIVKYGLRQLSLRRGEWVLEIGPGTGKALLFSMHAVGTLGRVVGVDLSEVMLQRANARIAGYSPVKNYLTICADGMRLPLKSAIFDAIFISFTLELFETEERLIVLQECRRVLSQHGRICVVALSGEEENSLMMNLYLRVQKRFPQWIDCKPILLEDLFLRSGFRLSAKERLSMFALPVDVVLAEYGSSLDKTELL